MSRGDNDRHEYAAAHRPGVHRTALTGHERSVKAVTFSPDGTLIATVSDDGTTRIWAAATGAHLATILALADGGYTTLLADGGYKIEGDPGDDLWWAIKLCRFGPGELDPYVPEIRRMEPEAPVLPWRR
jgi:WD40 repeat protein